MTPELWAEIERHYHEIVDLSEQEREVRLNEIANDEVRREVIAMIDGGTVDAQQIVSAVNTVAVQAAYLDQRLGPWRITGIVGHGGMGAVYVGMRDDHAFEKKVAIKMLHAEIGGTALERFRQERDILATLDHPNIAHLIDAGESDWGVPYIVMEYVDGRPVTSWCTERKLSVDAILRLFLRICGAVEYAHQKLVVHRDLKPGNILVTGDGSPKLLDFGIAKLLDAELKLTTTGLQALTPEYASPEQVEGRAISTASDVYSLGVVLYELLTGRSPYGKAAGNRAGMALTICKVAPDPPGLASDIDNILLMALRKEPGRRYPSVSAFAADIENYLGNRPIVAREDTLWYRTAKFARRNVIAIAAGTAVILALAGGVAVSQREAKRAQQRFDAVRGLANEFLFQIDEQLTHLPDSTRPRQESLRMLLRRLEPLASEAGNDSSLSTELAMAYEKIGELQRSLAHSGDPLASFNRSIGFSEPLRAAGKADSKTLGVLSRAYLYRGAVLYGLGRQQEAIGSLTTAIEVAQRSNFGDPGMFATVSQAQQYLGRIEFETNSVGRGTRLTEEAVSMAERAVAKAPGDESDRVLISSFLYHGRAVKLRGDFTGSAALTRRAVDWALRSYQVRPRSVVYRSRLMESYVGTTTGHSTTFEIPGLISSPGQNEKALMLAKDLTSADPENPILRNWMYIALVQKCVLERSDLGTALSACREALQMAEDLVATDRRSALHVRNRASARITLAEVLRLSGRHAESMEQAAQASSELESKLTDRESRAARLLCVLLLANIHFDRAKFEDAATHYHRARTMAESMWAGDETDMRMAAFVATIYEGLAACALKTKDRPKAAGWYAKSVAIWESWPRKGVTSQYDQSHLRNAQQRLKECLQ